MLSYLVLRRSEGEGPVIGHLEHRRLNGPCEPLLGVNVHVRVAGVQGVQNHPFLEDDQVLDGGYSRRVVRVLDDDDESQLVALPRAICDPDREVVAAHRIVFGGPPHQLPTDGMELQLQ